MEPGERRQTTGAPGHGPRSLPWRAWVRWVVRALRPAAARVGGTRGVALLAIGVAVGALLTSAILALSPGEPEGASGAADPNADITVTFTPGLLTALIRQSMAQGAIAAPLDNVRVATENGRLVLLGDVAVLGHGVGGSIEMEPYVQDGQLRLRVVQAHLGRLPVPGGLERIVEGPINTRVAAAVSGLPATVTGVQVSDAGLTVTARVQVQELGPS